MSGFEALKSIILGTKQIYGGRAVEEVEEVEGG